MQPTSPPRGTLWGACLFVVAYAAQLNGPSGKSPPSSRPGYEERNAPSAGLRYGIAVGSVLLSAGVAFLLRPASQTTPYLFFYPAVLASVWIGGFWPGVTATVLSGLASHFVLLASRGGWLDPTNLVRTTFFGATFVIVAYLAERRRVRVAAKLRYSEADLKRAQSLARIGNWRLRRNQLVWSAETYRIFGIAEDTPVTYETFLAAVHPDDRALVERQRQAAEAGAPYDYEHRIVVGGEVKWVREKAELEFDDKGAVRGGFGAVQDITERKRVEEALRNSEQRYRQLFENMSEGMAHCRMLFDEQGTPTDFIYLDVNSAFGRLTGLEDVIGKRVTEVIPGIREVHPELFEAYARVALTGRPEKFEIEVKPLNRWLSISVYSNEKEHFIAVFDNINARKRAEEALQESESRFRSFMDNSPSTAWMKDEQGRVVYLSRTFENRFGVRLEDWRGKTDAELWPEDIAKHFREDDLTVLASNRPLEVLEETTNPDGSKATWLTSKFPIISSSTGQRFVAGIGLDITERKRAEQALIQSEKLATVGRLAATVAHEINNPLSAVTNALYLLKADPALSTSARQLAEIADAEAKRVTQIAKQTLGLSRQVGPAPLRPAELLDGVLALLQRKLDQKGIKLTKQCDAALEIVGVSGEIRQVLWNLLNNAFEAVPSNGRIAVRIAHARDWRDQRVPGARITIADNGAGITREALAHIFVPFFTTKTTGNGLGLWVTNEIVNKHGGTIRVRSSTEGERRGTTFTIFVPVAPRQVSTHVTSARVERAAD